jgi:hypothetical protein
VCEREGEREREREISRCCTSFERGISALQPRSLSDKIFTETAQNTLNLSEKECAVCVGSSSKNGQKHFKAPGFWTFFLPPYLLMHADPVRFHFNDTVCENIKRGNGKYMSVLEREIAQGGEGPPKDGAPPSFLNPKPSSQG